MTRAFLVVIPHAALIPLLAALIRLLRLRSLFLRACSLYRTLTFETCGLPSEYIFQERTSVVSY